MADGASVPLWFSVLTFAGGVVSTQLSEMLRGRRESSVASKTRKQNLLDRRVEGQRAIIFEMQEGANKAFERYIFLLNSRSIDFSFSDTQTVENFHIAVREHEEFLLRWRLLLNRIDDTDMRRAAFHLLKSLKHRIGDERGRQEQAVDAAEAINRFFDASGAASRSLSEEQSAS